MPVKRVKTCGNGDEMQKKGKQKGCQMAVLNTVGLGSGRIGAVVRRRW